MLQSSYLNLSSFLAGSRLVKQPRSAGSACLRAVVVLITVVFRDNKEEPRCRDPRTGHQPSLLALPVWHVIVLLSQSKCVRGCSLWPLNVGILVPVVAEGLSCDSRIARTELAQNCALATASAQSQRRPSYLTLVSDPRPAILGSLSACERPSCTLEILGCL